jgi:PTS hybrid protein
MGEDLQRVGLVFVSHSEKIAEGLVELAAQMAPSVRLLAAGGTDGGGIGTSFEKVSAAIQAADDGRGVAVLCDLGSAILTAETALDFLDDVLQERVRVVDAALVEGGVAAAVTAESGGDLDAVVASARSAVFGEPAAQPSSPPMRGTGEGSGDRRAFSRTVTLSNSDGLHARPAAEFVKLANTFPVRVTVNGKDAKSLLGIMALGLVKGADVTIASDDADGEAAVTALADLVESGFGES